MHSLSLSSDWLMPANFSQFIYWVWHSMVQISLWPVQASTPGYASSQLLVHLLTGRAWETSKFLAEGKHCLPTATIAFYRHFSHTKPKNTALCHLLRRKLTQSQLKSEQIELDKLQGVWRRLLDRSCLRDCQQQNYDLACCLLQPRYWA